MGIPRTRRLLYSPWRTLRIPSARTPLGQPYRSPPSPIPGNRARGKRFGAPAHNRGRTRVPRILTSLLSSGFFHFFSKSDVHRHSISNSCLIWDETSETSDLAREHEKGVSGTHNHWNSGLTLEWERVTLVQPRGPSHQCHVLEHRDTYGKGQVCIKVHQGNSAQHPC